MASGEHARRGQPPPRIVRVRQQHPGEQRDQQDAERGQRIGHVPRGRLRLGHRAHRMLLRRGGRIRVDPRRAAVRCSCSRRPPRRPDPRRRSRSRSRRPGSFLQARRSVAQQHRAVDLGSLVRSAAGHLGPHALDQDIEPLADPALGSLADQFLGQVGDAGPAGLDLSSDPVLSRQPGGGRAVLVGVAEHADRVQLGGGEEISAADPSSASVSPGNPQITLLRIPACGAAARIWSIRARNASGFAEAAHPAQHAWARRAGRTGRSRAPPCRCRSWPRSGSAASRPAAGRTPGSTRCRRRPRARPAGLQRAGDRPGPCRRRRSSR